MKLEDEIQQKRFKNAYQKLLVNIIYTGNWINGLNNKRLKQFGISSQQYNLLRILRGQHPEPARIGLLSERMLDKMSNASRLVEKLRLKGLVERVGCQSDRRAVDVKITGDGLALLTELDVLEEEWIARFKNIDEAEAGELNRMLDKLRD